jgi:lipoate---protein ligase
MPQIMEKLDRTAEEQLGRDLQLFQRVEDGAADYGWRLWEADTAAVVLGRFGNTATDVLERHCQRDGVPVVRRCSGGGAVVVGRGCLNFAVAFALPVHPELADVARSFSIVLHRIARALTVEGLSIEGGTDLVVGGRKVSGNAQRRGRRAVLHHGTLLYDFDPMLAARYLREPRRQPTYREHRPHTDFMGCLRIPRDLLTARLSEGFAVPAHRNLTNRSWLHEDLAALPGDSVAQAGRAFQARRLSEDTCRTVGTGARPGSD